MSVQEEFKERQIDLRLPDGLILFFIKTVFVALVIAVVAIITTNMIVSRVEESTHRSLANLSHIGGAQFWVALEKSNRPRRRSVVGCFARTKRTAPS